MPTYEYECKTCGLLFEQRQAMVDAPLEHCPACSGEVQRLVSGGAGFIVKGGSQTRGSHGGDACSFETTGTTCCGRDERCGKASCG